MQAHENGSAHTSPPPRMSCPSASLLGKNHNNLIIPEWALEQGWVREIEILGRQ